MLYKALIITVIAPDLFLIHNLFSMKHISCSNQYMGFGLSGSTSATLMFGADPTITWVDETDGPQAVDYYLSGYTQVRSNNKLAYNIVMP